MTLSLYVIGAPSSGKSTVFEALTNTPQGPSFSTKGDHRLGSVKVPDERLEDLRGMYQPKKFTPAEVTFVDVGLPPGASDNRSLSELTTFLGEADAFLLVLQAFGEFDYRGEALDSKSQLEAILLELVVADLDKVERRLEKIAQEQGRGNKGLDAEGALVEKCKAQLEQEKPLSEMEFSEEEEKLLRGYQFLSLKPVLVVANLDEDNLEGSGLEDVKSVCDHYGHELMTFCATLESEIAQLDPEAQQEFLKDYGLTDPVRDRLIRKAYQLLNLISFFTVGEDEVRAWTIDRGTPAQTAAGKIHSDIERGFIRAETIGYKDLLEQGSWSKCRDQALMRLEGKTYEVADGDVINFRFNT